MSFSSGLLTRYLYNFIRNDNKKNGDHLKVQIKQKRVLPMPII